MARGTRKPFTLLLMLALVATAVALVGVRPAPAAGSGPLKVRWFYASTSEEYSRWSQHGGTLPRLYAAFPSGTKQVALYFGYAGAGKASGYYLVLRRHDGATIDVAGYNKMTAGTGAFMDQFTFDRALPNGGYYVDLVVDDRLVRTLSLAIGYGLIPSFDLVVTSFYPISDAAEAGWKDYMLPPPATVKFPAGTASMAVVLLYTGATPNATYHVVERNSSAAQISDSGPI